MSKSRDPAVLKKGKPRKRKTVRACQSGKVRYRDRQEAITTLHKLHSVSHRQKMQTRVYECPFCNGWHLTARGEAA